MAGGFFVTPRQGAYRLSNAAIPAVLLAEEIAGADADGVVRAELTIDNGNITGITGITGITSAASGHSRTPVIDLDGGMLWPCLVDMHTHLDKGHIWPRAPNPDGTFDGALNATDRDRTAHWSAEDVHARMEFALRCAYAHGTALIRTHLDSIAPQHAVSWPVFAETRDRWAGRIDLQAAALVPIDQLADRAVAADLTATIVEHDGVFGAVTFMVPELDRLLDDVMERAGKAELDLDFHVDETHDPTAQSLRAIADAVRRTGFTRRVVVGHCCSLTTQPRDQAAATIDAVAEAGVAVVSLPMCNLYLQDRAAGRTPRWRGITALHELARAGVTTAVASDNTRDPFYAYGDLDMLEVFREAVRIGQLDHPIAESPRLAARSPATMMGRPERGVISVGQPADLVAFRARTYTELLSRPQADRAVIRNGRTIDCTLPDYRELDTLMEAPA